MDDRIFDYSDFVAWFPQFADTAKYPADSVQACGNRALLHIGHEVCEMPMKGCRRNYALYLMAAHIIELGEISNGTGMTASGNTYKATIGSVQIENSKQNSFTLDDWNYWLGQTPHGRELLAFLEVQAPIGVFLNTARDSVRDLV